MSSAPDFVFVGNRLCLDFVNTELVSDGEPLDLLADCGDLVAWLRAAGVLGLPGERAADPCAGAVGERLFRRAVELRAALRRTAERLVSGEGVDDAALAAIDGVLADSPRRRRLRRDGDGFAVDEEAVGEGSVQLLEPIAASAAALLADDDLSRVAACDGAGCLLFFYDVTKNRGRRWCSMEACGARAKSAAYYRRQRRGYTGAR